MVTHDSKSDLPLVKITENTRWKNTVEVDEFLFILAWHVTEQKDVPEIKSKFEEEKKT